MSPGTAHCTARTAASPPCNSVFPAFSPRVRVDSSRADVCATDVYLLLRFEKTAVLAPSPWNRRDPGLSWQGDLKAAE